jgi:predicted NUDIX family phosphoesterase
MSSVSQHPVLILGQAKSLLQGLYMGDFLRAAYEVLKKENRPLSAREIADIAVERGELRSDGKTPFQTMKSKLSTEILHKGPGSPFMRVAEGRFALREWGKHEHIANRYQKALFDEDIVVFPAESLPKYVSEPGLRQTPFDRDALMAECRPMRRRLAEDTYSVIQLVSVFIVRHEDKYLTYKRTKRLPESRLHGYYSCAFGGHLNPADLKPLLNIFDPDLAGPLLLRELGEELRIDSSDSLELRYRGLLYDNSRDISKQHLGIAYDVLTSRKEYEIGERGFLMDAKYETLSQIVTRLSEFENWSVLLMNEELKRRQADCSKTLSLF